MEGSLIKRGDPRERYFMQPAPPETVTEIEQPEACGAAYLWKDAEYMLRGLIDIDDFMKMLHRAQLKAFFAGFKRYDNLHCSAWLIAIGSWIFYPLPLVIFGAVLINLYIFCRAVWTIDDFESEFLTREMEAYLLAAPEIRSNNYVFGEVTYFSAGVPAEHDSESLVELIRD